MKTLFLMRHAKSSWKEPVADHDRTLNKRGLANVPMMAERLKTRSELPQLIVTSSAKRALMTSRLFQEALEGVDAEIEINPTLYLAEPATLLELLRSFDGHYSSVMLVGHNPGVTEFCNQLCGETIENMPTASIAKIVFDVPSWSDIALGEGVLDFFDFPKKRG